MQLNQPRNYLTSWGLNPLLCTVSLNSKTHPRDYWEGDTSLVLFWGRGTCAATLLGVTIGVPFLGEAHTPIHSQQRPSLVP